MHVCAASILILGRARIILHLAFNILDKQQVWWSATGVPGRGKHHNDNVSAPAANNNVSAPTANNIIFARTPDNEISAPTPGQHQLPPPTTPALPCSSPSLLWHPGTSTATSLPCCQAINKFFVQPRCFCSQDSSLHHPASFQPSCNVSGCLSEPKRPWLYLMDLNEYYWHTTENPEGLIWFADVFSLPSLQVSTIYKYEWKKYPQISWYNYTNVKF